MLIYLFIYLFIYFISYLFIYLFHYLSNNSYILYDSIIEIRCISLTDICQVRIPYAKNHRDY